MKSKVSHIWHPQPFLIKVLSRCLFSVQFFPLVLIFALSVNFGAKFYGTSVPSQDWWQTLQCVCVSTVKCNITLSLNYMILLSCPTYLPTYFFIPQPHHILQKLSPTITMIGNMVNCQSSELLYHHIAISKYGISDMASTNSISSPIIREVWRSAIDGSCWKLDFLTFHILAGVHICKCWIQF